LETAKAAGVGDPPPVQLSAPPALTQESTTEPIEPPRLLTDTIEKQDAGLESDVASDEGLEQEAFPIEIQTAAGLEARDTAPQEQQPAPIQSAVVDAPEAAPVTSETANVQEEAYPIEVTSQRGEEYPPTKASPLEEESPVSMSDVAVIAADVSPQGQPDVDEEPFKKHVKPAQHPRSRAPKNRGGHPRGEGEGGEGEKTGKIHRRSAKPEIVCWKREGEWILGVEIPEELQGAMERAVFQDGVPLMQDAWKGDRWRLAKLGGEVVVCISDSQSENKLRIELKGDDHLLFKLQGANLNEGRRVKQPSSGSYLVVVPDNWERDAERAGTARYQPERVCVEGYEAHFFDVPGDSASRIAFRDHIGRPLEIGSTGPRFELVGQKPDASEHAGSLFGVSPPRILVKDGSWADVGAIVLGEEGSGRARWRTSLELNPAVPEQQLPDEVISRKAGWYFLRFYDLQDELIESLDFRFVAGLRKITVHYDGHFPPPTGHVQATVEFQHDAECSVKPSLAETTDVRVDRKSEKTTLMIPPTPHCDRSRWLLGPPNGPRVEVDIMIERIWWAVDRASQKPSQWQDTCLRVTPEDFRATSNTALWIRFPRSRWTDSVFVGFEQVNRQRFDIRVTEDTIAVSLRDLDSGELRDRSAEHSLKAWIERNGTVHQAAMVTVPAEGVPGALDITFIPAYRLAAVLTTLHRATRGPLRQMLKEIRCHYRGARRSRAESNDEFKKEALCAIDVFLQLARPRQSIIPKGVSGWRSKAGRATHEFPETARKVWRQHNELKNRPGRGKGSGL
jgi:hypothetical protein